MPPGELTYEWSARRLRGTVGEQVVLESRPMLVWEPGMPIPRYAVPREALRTEWLTPARVEPRLGIPARSGTSTSGWRV